MTAPGGEPIEGVSTPMEEVDRVALAAVTGGILFLMSQTIPPSVVGSAVGIVGWWATMWILVRAPHGPVFRMAQRVAVRKPRKR